MRIVVVGGGIIGLLTSMACVDAGHEVTIVEQGSLPHAGASSYDRHRVLRALHLGDPGATRAAVTAHRLWRELETHLSARVYHTVGALTVLPAERLTGGLGVLAEAGAPARVLDPAELADAYGCVDFPSGRHAILEENAGVLLADRALRAVAGRLRGRPGVRLRTGQAVVRVDAAARSVLLGDGEVLRGDRIVVATGPWSRGLLPAALAEGLTLYRQTMLYCRVPARHRRAWSDVPAIPALGTSSGAWLVPPVGDTPLKLSADEVCRAVPGLAGYEPPAAASATLSARFRELIRGFDVSWITGARDCYYTSAAVGGDTAGGPVLLDLAGGAVLAYVACGGGSFKYAPVIARALAARCAGAVPAPTGLPALDRPRYLPDTTVLHSRKEAPRD